MPRAYSTDLRQRAVAAYQRGGRTMEEVAHEYAISTKTLSDWLRLAEEKGSVAPRPRGGGNFSPIQGQVLEALLKLVRELPDSTAQEHYEELVHRTGVATSRSAVVRALLRRGLSYKKSPSSPRKPARPASRR
jgi:transposase